MKYLNNNFHQARQSEISTTDISLCPLLNPHQQHVLMKLLKLDDPVAKKQVIAHNLSLVVNIAKRYSNHGEELLDLVNEGIQGLIHALENFEREGGFRFAAYAARCVRQHIERAICNRNDRLALTVFQ